VRRAIGRGLHATLLIGVAAWCVAARAGVTVSSSGHTLFGGASAWAAAGKVFDGAGNQLPGWDHADFTPAYQHTLAIQDGEATVDLFNNVGTQTSGTANLSAAARVSVQNLQSGKVYARGWSLAMINDRIRVMPADAQMMHATVELEWKVHGTLGFRLESSQVPLNFPQGFKWAHHAMAQTFVTWRHPTTFVEQTDRMGNGEESMRKPNTSLTDEQRGGLHYLQADGEPTPQTINAEWAFNDNAMEFAPSPLQVNHTGFFNRAIHVPTIASVEVMLGLFVSYNAVWDVKDFSGLDSNLEAMFDQTAELTGVRLFDGSGAPYTGQWSLQSDNGIAYPLAPVPEPAALALPAAVGLVVGRRALRRRASRWLPGR